jgi:hypothetical protein
MSGFERTASAETIARAWSPRTSDWSGRSGFPRFDVGAVALSGVSEPQLSYWLWSVGHQDPSIASKVAADLMSRFGGLWPRAETLVALAMRELALGYAADRTARLSEVSRAASVGVSRTHWYRVWRSRYRELLGAAQAEIAAADLTIGRRLFGDGLD